MIAENELKDILSRYVARGGVGASLAFAVGDAPVQAVAAGIADRREGTPVTTERLFKIGSCTKTFFVASLLRLLDEKGIDLATPIVEWFPNIPNGDRIAACQLVNHRNGLPEFEYGISMDFERRWKPEELVELAFQVGQQEQPGGAAVYNNTGYALAAILVERLSGMSVGAWVRESVLVPLGLRNTYSPATESFPEEQLVRGYYYRPAPAGTAPVGTTIAEIRSGGEMWRMEGILEYSDDLQDSTKTFPYSAAIALGDMVATPSDQVTFMRGLFSGGLFGPEWLERMTGDRSPISFPGSRMQETGMGLLYSTYGGRHFFGHQGSIPGYACTMQHDPESGVTIALTTNVGSGDRASFQASGLHPVVDEAIAAIDRYR